MKPMVSSISPNKALIGTSNSVTITGTGFVSGSTSLSITGGFISGVTVQSSTTITANYLIDDDASAGNHAVTVTVNGQSSTDPVNFYVQIPTSLNVLSVAIIPTQSGNGSVCTSGQNYGIQVAVQYQVLDQAGDPIVTDDMEPQKTITNAVFNNGQPVDIRSTFGDLGPSDYPGTSQFTDTSGRFLDAPYGFCSNASTTFTFTQVIRIVALNQNHYDVRTNNVSITSSSSGSGTITNGGDIQKSRP